MEPKTIAYPARMTVYFKIIIIHPTSRWHIHVHEFVETQNQALAARAKVKIQYINTKKPLVTIKDAIDANSFFKINDPSQNDVICGDAEGNVSIFSISVSNVIL